MSDYIDTRDGWRNATSEEDYAASDEWLTLYSKTGGARKRWVRESPVPPLPTDRGTVIRVTWVKDHYEWVILWGPVWHNVATGEIKDLSAITSWEPVSEPRAVTAKAVLDRVEEIDTEAYALETWTRVVAREFGVES